MRLPPAECPGAAPLPPGATCRGVSLPRAMRLQCRRATAPRDAAAPCRARGRCEILPRKRFPAGPGVRMQKRMGEAVARVARRVNDTVENKSDSLDLAECKLMTFPVGIYKAVRSVADGIHRITLANNELKALASRFVTTFSQLRELNLEGNYLHRLPEEVGSLPHLRAINLSRNRFRHFPEPLAAISALETIELEENEIAGGKKMQNDTVKPR
ncbi:leucine-rich repeat-containing protein 20 isoform X3 [Apteryx rowi]|uniref:leucine-rich repeat-containing protein 20 isoform X3 n=1 Tax=Apteryx rowi TaxID=308060 RepID=UPI000E1D7B54|nr:leucine-rich repeat-containing protein 20 isoform X3 [Apteryx rowi]